MTKVPVQVEASSGKGRRARLGQWRKNYVDYSQTDWLLRGHQSSRIFNELSEKSRVVAHGR